MLQPRDESLQRNLVEGLEDGVVEQLRAEQPDAAVRVLRRGGVAAESEKGAEAARWQRPETWRASTKIARSQCP